LFQTKKATNIIGGLLVLYFAAVVIIEVIMGTKSYSTGHIFIAIGVLGIMSGSGICCFGFVRFLLGWKLNHANVHFQDYCCIGTPTTALTRW
jgi:hypothetical protein